MGSLQITANRGTFICSATPFDATHVLTAGHCVDLNDDGKSDKKDGIRSITFNLNSGGNLTSQIRAASWDIHPDFTGFNRPSINDDLAVITLTSSVPPGVPTYSLATSDMVAGTTHLYLVGYGRSGDGVNGYTTNASFTVKRRGENMADNFNGQDDTSRAAANEVFFFDFDGPSGNGTYGGPTLGNDKETTLGGGDSGGPSFVLCAGCEPTLASSFQLAGVNTFTQGVTAPKFGSLGGGINIFPYAGWILGPHPAIGPSGGGGSGGTGGGAPSGNALGRAVDAVLIVPPSDVSLVSSAAQTTSETSASSVSTGDTALTADQSLPESPAPESQVILVLSSTASSQVDSSAGASSGDSLAALDAVLEGGGLEEGV